MLGSVYLGRYSRIKTTVIGTAFIFLYLLYCKLVSDQLLGHGYFWNGLEIFQTSDREFEGVRVYGGPGKALKPRLAGYSNWHGHRYSGL